METVNFESLPASATSEHHVATPVPPQRALHRIRAVRLEQGVSLRTVGRHTGQDVRSLRLQEDAQTDLKLSELYAWQRVLDVPVADLLVESEGPLSRPVMERAQLIRIMKTAAAILEAAPNAAMQRMATTLVDQLIEIMPELKEVSPWHTYGQRRSLNEYGRVVERRLSEDMFQSSWDDD